MNILYHHRTQGRGVEGVHIREMVKAFTGLGHTVDIVGPVGVSALRNTIKYRQNLLSKFWRCLSKHMPEFCFEILELFYNIYSYWKINKLFIKKKYDLIYERYAIFSWAAVRYAKKNKIPIILELSYTSFTPLLRKRSKLFSSLAHKIDKILFKKADGLVVVSTYLKEQLIKLGIEQEKIIMLPNAADPEVFTPTVSGNIIRDKYRLQGKKNIGFVGGLNYVHGLDFLIHIIPTILDKEKECIFLIIGDGQLKQDLKNRIRDMNLEDKVLLLGNVDHRDLQLYISTFDIAIVPDSNNYGSPMKIFEYMAMGKPIVAPRLGPITDAITDGKEGLLFKARDEEGIIKALLPLLKDANLRCQMGNNGRAKLVDNFTWEKNAKSVINFYNKTVLLSFSRYTTKPQNAAKLQKFS